MSRRSGNVLRWDTETVEINSATCGRRNKQPSPWLDATCSHTHHHHHRPGTSANSGRQSRSVSKARVAPPLSPLSHPLLIIPILSHRRRRHETHTPADEPPNTTFPSSAPRNPSGPAHVLPHFLPHFLPQSPHLPARRRDTISIGNVTPPSCLPGRSFPLGNSAPQKGRLGGVLEIRGAGFEAVMEGAGWPMGGARSRAHCACLSMNASRDSASQYMQRGFAPPAPASAHLFQGSR